MKSRQLANKANIKRTSLNPNVILFIICSIFLGDAIITLGAETKKVTKTDLVTRPLKIVRTMVEFEKSNPGLFIEVKGSVDGFSFNNQLKVSGELTNLATEATYKNIVLGIVCYDALGQEIGRMQYMLYDSFPANTKKPVEINIDRPYGCMKIEFNALNATAY